MLFVALHNANRKCALFGRALTKSKLKVLNARWRNGQSTNVSLSDGTLDIRH